MRFRIFGVFGTNLEEFMYLMSDLLTPSQEGRGAGGGGGGGYLPRFSGTCPDPILYKNVCFHIRL